jgi:hypothetical protein
VARLVRITLQHQNPQEFQRLHAEVTAIEKELVSLRAQLKKETMFNRKVELDVQIKSLETQKESIIPKTWGRRKKEERVNFETC